MSAPRGISDLDLEKLTRIFKQLQKHARYLAPPTTLFKFSVESRLKKIPKADRDAVVKVADMIYFCVSHLMDSVKNLSETQRLINEAREGKFSEYLKEFLDVAQGSLRIITSQIDDLEGTPLSERLESLANRITELSEYKHFDSILTGRPAIILEIESWVEEFQEADSWSMKNFIATKLKELASVINGNDVLREHLGPAISKANTEIERSSLISSHELQLLKVIKIQECFIDPIDLPDIEAYLEQMLKTLNDLERESKKMQIPVEVGSEGRKYEACTNMLTVYLARLNNAAVELRDSTTNFQKNFAGSNKFAAVDSYIESLLAISESITQSLKNLKDKNILLDNDYWIDAFVSGIITMSSRLRALQNNAKIKADEVKDTSSEYKNFKATPAGNYIAKYRALINMERKEQEENKANKKEEDVEDVAEIEEVEETDEARKAREAKESDEDKKADEAEAKKAGDAKKVETIEAKEINFLEGNFLERRKKRLDVFNSIMQDKEIPQQVKNNLAAINPILHEATRLEILVRMLPEEASQAFLKKQYLSAQKEQKTVFPRLKRVPKLRLPTIPEGKASKVPELKLSAIKSSVVNAQPKAAPEPDPKQKPPTRFPKVR